MWLKLFPLLVLVWLPVSVSWAQEIPQIQLETTAWRIGSILPQTPAAQNQNCRGTAPRLFWIIPTYTVTNLRSPAPLTPNEKFHLVLADKTDPFNIGQIAVYAGIV